jgi:hypothetical protein
MTEKIDFLEPTGKKKTKIVEYKTYDSWITRLFRWENWVRAIGVYVMYESKVFPVSVIDAWGVKIRSDLSLFVLGVAIAIAGPDAIEWAKEKFRSRRKKQPDDFETT